MEKNNYINKILIILAIAMMTSSALVSYFIVKNNEPKISFLKSKIQNHQTLIRDVWSSAAKKENKANLAIIISTLKENRQTEVQEIINYYLEDFSTLNSTSNTSKMVEEIKKDVKENREYIDTLYIEQMSYQNELDHIESVNKIYSDIAFFLQIFSVILVLLRKEHIG